MAVYYPNDPDWWDYACHLDELADALGTVRMVLKEMEQDKHESYTISLDEVQDMIDGVEEEAENIRRDHPDYFDPYERAGVRESDF
jgi:hypothetical protein